MHTHNDSQPAPKLTRHLPDAGATIALGKKIASVLRPGLAIYLQGDLGAGKTTLARGILRGFGYQGKVKSPSFALVELYTFSSLYLYHFDFYRFSDPSEWEDAGFREYFNPEAICLVEWPEKVGPLLPPADLQISLAVVESGRSVEIRADTEAGRQCLEQLQK